MRTNLDKKIEKCPLCGFEFYQDEAQKACIQCPLTQNCKIYCCPHCHYQFIQESKMVTFIQKLKEWRGKTQ